MEPMKIAVPQLKASMSSLELTIILAVYTAAVVAVATGTVFSGMYAIGFIVNAAIWTGLYYYKGKQEVQSFNNLMVLSKVMDVVAALPPSQLLEFFEHPDGTNICDECLKNTPPEDSSTEEDSDE